MRNSFIQVGVAITTLCALAAVAVFCACTHARSTPAAEKPATESREAVGLVIAGDVQPEAAEAEQPRANEPKMVSLGVFTVSHYCPCEKCCGKDDGITATGTVATPGRTLAVDPSVIPFGSKVVLKYEDGTVDDYIAEDRGGAINGKKVDVFMGQHRAAVYAGIRRAEVFLVEGYGK